ncbi:MAG: class I SAM-dependent RNA methyltransferase [Synergistetes bacterium]|nr:class I SAM-dependent RNA methyltransferase [Synergistota bacterium]MCX8127685.1 class I SAM-dependent RNA methyltransferase [Synergistota bacterium]MDW8191400.1 class I SAM-dependent RNA methyltransferase [Synergistota bacterium]
MRLFIEKMVYGGYGLCRTPDGLIFVKGGISGEVVEARIKDRRKSYSFANIVEVIEPSPFRVSPRCSYFGICGGCDWQHISYEAQICLKNQVLEDVFKRIGGFSIKPELISEGQPWGYRYRARFHSDHRGRLGFFKEGTNEIVWVGDCPILVSSINEAKRSLEEIRGFEKGEEISIICSYGSGEVLVHIKEGVKKRKREKLKELPFSIIERKSVLKGKPYIFGKWCNLDIRFSYDSFSQVNPKVGEELYFFIVKELKEVKKVWYLYGGVGILAMLLAIDGKEVKLIEVNSSAVEDAEENLRRYGLLGKVEVIRGDVGRIFPSLLFDFEAEALVADPPREGMGKEVIDAIKRSNIRKLIYVSCHPPVLARDANVLKEAGYNLVALKWVDMFPQTSHIEAIGILCKGGG